MDAGLAGQAPRIANGYAKVTDSAVAGKDNCAIVRPAVLPAVSVPVNNVHEVVIPVK
jgi:hypothetical protein